MVASYQREARESPVRMRHDLRVRDARERDSADERHACVQLAAGTEGCNMNDPNWIGHGLTAEEHELLRRPPPYARGWPPPEFEIHRPTRGPIAAILGRGLIAIEVDTNALPSPRTADGELHRA